MKKARKPTTKSKVAAEGLGDRLLEKVFQIQLNPAAVQKYIEHQNRNNKDGSSPSDKLPPDVYKALKMEYATKYLESLKIEPNKSNINMILKMYPLENCEIEAGFNASGLIANTMTISARKKKKLENNDQPIIEESELPEQTVKETEGNKPLAEQAKECGSPTKGDPSSSKKNGPPNQKAPNGSNKNNNAFPSLSNAFQANDEEEKEEKYHFQLDYSIEYIKRRYLFPFNQTTEKKVNQKMKDDPSASYLPQLDANSVKNDIINKSEYLFPFSHFKLSDNDIKTLQNPLRITSQDIAEELKKYGERFPIWEIPYERRPKEQENFNDNSSLQQSVLKKDSTSILPSLQGRKQISFRQEDVEFSMDLIASAEMTRLVGIIAHLAYWQVLGHISPIQPDQLTKKQMLIASFDQLNLIRKKVKNVKLWSNLTMPLLLLALRMMIEWIFKNSYLSFFEFDKCGDVALEKINMLITELFDPNNFFSRFSFLESELTAVHKKVTEHLGERKLLNKRIYSVSPYMDILFPNPESGFVRSMFARKTNKFLPNVHKTSNTRDDTLDFLEEEDHKRQQADLEEDVNNDNIKKSYKVKMFQIALDKLDSEQSKRIGKKNNVFNLSAK